MCFFSMGFRISVNSFSWATESPPVSNANIPYSSSEATNAVCSSTLPPKSSFILASVFKSEITFSNTERLIPNKTFPFNGIITDYPTAIKYYTLGVQYYQRIRQPVIGIPWGIGMQTQRVCMPEGLSDLHLNPQYSAESSIKKSLCAAEH